MKPKDLKQYYKDHECCPDCGNINVKTTTMGPGWFDGHDRNHASCSCGWKGRIRNLVPEGVR